LINFFPPVLSPDEEQIHFDTFFEVSKALELQQIPSFNCFYCSREITING